MNLVRQAHNEPSIDLDQLELFLGVLLYSGSSLESEVDLLISKPSLRVKR